MPEASERSGQLIALNADLGIGREAVCKLALEMDAWVPGGRGKPAGAAALGVSAPELKAARRAVREAGEVAGRERAAAERLGARVITLVDEDYPAKLRELALSPPVLYCRGRVPARPAVAIVGSRQADPFGVEAAELFGRELAGRGITIVSGLARGVDGAAHRGALAARGGRTVAVLGCGLDVDYPKEHGRLAAEVAARGAVLSEFPMGAAPIPLNFPIRNRIIAALAVGTLVVQAAPRSGSLITARLALELGRDVYACPGRIFDPRATGANRLIRDGALLALDPRDVLESLPVAVQEELFAGGEGEAGPAGSIALPDGPMGELLQRMTPGEMLAADELAAEAGIPVDRVLALLLELELGGWVRRHPGPAYCRRA